MRTLAIGDIHGCFTALKTLAKFAGFSDDDQLVALGDYVDKGPDVAKTLDWLCDRDAAGNLVALRGNHDLMMLEARQDAEKFERWMECNGYSTLASYGLPAKRGSLDKIPKRHWKFLEATVLYHEMDHAFFVHGNVYPDRPLKKQPGYMLLWEKFYDPPPHESGKLMVCGHTSQKDGKLDDAGHAVCIDTWACGEGWLTALDPASGKFWQADELGETRTGQR